MRDKREYNVLFFSIFQRHIVSSTKGRTAPFANQLNPEGNLLVDDIEVKSAHRVGSIAPQIIHLSSLSAYEFD